ncbi:quinone oxidoreductase family protein [Jatrophihabitans sp. YIM 134969]
MQAAVVTAFDEAPHFTSFPEPVARGPHEVVVDVLAAGLHPRVRSQARGAHYTSTAVLPFVPGVDGVGREPDGTLRYFVLPDDSVGAMAHRTVVDTRRSIVLPPDSDPVAVAAAMNPAMSSWVALRHRAAFTAGQSVLVLGATGSAGRLAVQVARLLGAGRVVAAGRGIDRVAAEVEAHGAEVVDLADEAGLVAAADVDVVLDYLWGPPTVAAVTTLVTARPDRSHTLTWVEIGSVAGSTAAIPSAALRSSALRFVGSGQGSVGAAQMLAEFPAITAAVTAGDLEVDAEAVALADVEAAWNAPGGSRRVVLVP